MSRKGIKNKRTIAREQQALSGINIDSLDAVAEAMDYFRREARLADATLQQELVKRNPNPQRILELRSRATEHYAALRDTAKELAPYRYPKLSAIKIAQPVHDDLAGKSLEQLKAELYTEFQELFGYLPLGLADRTSTSANGQEPSCSRIRTASS